MNFNSHRDKIMLIEEKENIIFFQRNFVASTVLFERCLECIHVLCRHAGKKSSLGSKIISRSQIANDVG